MKPRRLAFLLISCLIAGHSFGGSATWNPDPASGDWNTAANWTPATIPDNPGAIATFAESNHRSVSISSTTKVANIVFAADASPFTISANPRLALILGGAGIINSSTTVQNFFTATEHSGEYGAIQFLHNATVTGPVVFTNRGSSHFSRGGKTQFVDYSNAGDGIFVNEGGRLFGGVGGRTTFHGHASAGHATFTNESDDILLQGGYTAFSGNSTADHGTFTNSGSNALVSFYDFSTAADATFVNNNLGRTQFTEHASAGRCTIINNGESGSDDAQGYCAFYYNSDAGESTLIANSGSDGRSGGSISFRHSATGGTASVMLYGNGTLDLTIHDPNLTIGSLEGDGNVILGAVNLAIGSNDQSTTFSGVIDEGTSLLIGALTKVGLSTLVLTGANAYDGGTTIEGGILSIDNQTGSATGTGAVMVSAGTLAGSGVCEGLVIVGADNGASGFLEPSAAVNAVTTLTTQKTLTFKATGSYKCLVDTETVQSDQVVAVGVRINNGAQFALASTGASALALGTVFTVISNTSGDPIIGNFQNLTVGSTITAGNNAFQANFEGGDGNDLTLTVVP